MYECSYDKTAGRCCIVPSTGFYEWAKQGKKEDEDRWLDPELKDPAILQAMLKPYPAEAMERFPVPAVNSPFYLACVSLRRLCFCAYFFETHLTSGRPASATPGAFGIGKTSIGV